MGEKKQRFNKLDMARDRFQKWRDQDNGRHFELENILERHKVQNKTLVCDLYRIEANGNRDN